MKAKLQCTGIMLVFLLLCASCSDEEDPIVALHEVTAVEAVPGMEKATVSWQLPADPNFSYIQIVYPGLNGPIWLSKETTSWEVLELTERVDYVMTVRTVDALGNTSEGVSVTVTPEHPPLVDPTLPGFLDDDFLNGTNGWMATTAGSSLVAEDGKLVVTLATGTKGRGDIKKDGGVTLHAGNYPIVAIRMEKPKECNVIFDTNFGSPFNGKNNWTGVWKGNVYYWDLREIGFGKDEVKLPTTEETVLTTFQFKVADITSGETTYTVDWVKTFTSVEELEATVVDPPGKINDNFDNSTEGWMASTGGSSLVSENGQLKVTLATGTKGRGDIRKEEGATLVAGDYPILAIKMQRPAEGNVIFDTNLGPFGNGKNNWTGVVGEDIYYYDLRETGFGADGTKLSTTEPTVLGTFQFKVADITSGETFYTVDWIKTFKSLEELQEEL